MNVLESFSTKTHGCFIYTCVYIVVGNYYNKNTIVIVRKAYICLVTLCQEQLAACSRRTGVIWNEMWTRFFPLSATVDIFFCTFTTFYTPFFYACACNCLFAKCFKSSNRLIKTYIFKRLVLPITPATFTSYTWCWNQLDNAECS